MDGKEKRLLKDAIKSLNTGASDVKPKRVTQAKIVKRATRLAKERGIIKTRKKALRHFEQYENTETYIRKQVGKLLGEENRIALINRPEAGVNRELTAAVKHSAAAPVATDKKGEKAASQRHSASPNARVTESKRRKQDKEPVSTENHAANAAEQMQNVVCKSVSPTARTEGNGKKKKKRKLQDVGTPKEHPSTDSGGAGGEAIVGKKKRKRSNPTAVAEATQAGDQSKDAEPQLKAVSDGSPGSKAGPSQKEHLGRLSWAEDGKRTEVKSGSFSKAEDDSLLTAVKEYAELHDLEQDDLSWVSHLYTAKKASNQKHKDGALAQSMFWQASEQMAEAEAFWKGAAGK